MEKREIGERIKSLRRSTKLSQERLAELADLSVDTISGIERGKNLPSYETYSKLAKAFGLKVADLTNESGDGLPLERAKLIADVNVEISKATDRQLRLIRDLIAVALKHT